MDVPVAANILGTTGAVCWSIQLIPQIVVNYRRHNATGLQPSMMMLWAWAGVPLGVYNIVNNFNIALQVQPQILTTLSLMTWIQCYHYKHQWNMVRSLGIVAPIALIMAGTQVGLVFALRRADDQELDWPIKLMAALSAALLAAGVLRHYWDIYTHRTVRGISFLFVGIDAAGDLFSLLSIIFQPELDVLGMVIYGVELVLWIGVFACGGYFNLRPWIRGKVSTERARSRNAGQAQSEYVDTSDLPGGPHGPITLHESPSSTPVFHTTSNEVSLRRTHISNVGSTQCCNGRVSA